MEATTKPAEELANLNETGQRQKNERRQQDEPVVAERRKVQRRRLIDPTTCERDYSRDEIEFMQAMDDYKRKSGRMFPTCSEILEVLRDMGYVRVDLPVEEEVTDQAEQVANDEKVRTADAIAGDLDAFHEEELDSQEYEADFDDEEDE